LLHVRRAQSSGRSPLRRGGSPHHAACRRAMSVAVPAVELGVGGTRERGAVGLPATMLCLFVLVAVAAPLMAPADPARQSLWARLRPPGTSAAGVTHWLGTDELGRDLLSRVLYGARVSLLVAFLSVCVSGSFGTMLGMLAGFHRGLVEGCIMRAVDMV